MTKIDNIKEKIKKIGPVIVVSLILIGAAVVLVFAKQDEDGLTASGTIEAIQVRLSPQVSGQVLEILVDEGDQVKKGDTLVRLDDAQLQAQVNQASSLLFLLI